MHFNVSTYVVDVTLFPGLTPLMHASCEGYLCVVKYLVEHKANMDAKNNDGNEIFRHYVISCLRFFPYLSIASTSRNHSECLPSLRAIVFYCCILSFCLF